MREAWWSSTVSANVSVAVTDLDGVFTYRNDKARAGANTKEYALNTSNVKSGTFGKQLCVCLSMRPRMRSPLGCERGYRRRTRNIVIAATQRDTVPMRSMRMRSMPDVLVEAGELGDE